MGLDPDSIPSPAIISDSVISSPLPITLLSFSVTKVNEYVDINWSTSSEINNDYFTLKKSSDLINWYHIANVRGAGNSNKPMYYTYLDNYYKDVIYYRLSQTDYDGTTVEFDIVSLKVNKIDDVIKIYPNPVKKGEYIIICCDVIEQIEIVSLDGRPVRYLRHNNNVKIYTTGTYIIIVNNKHKQKIVVN